jgi:mono/diheme cytochrome c family protein
MAATALAAASPNPKAAQTTKANSSSSTDNGGVARGKELYLKNSCYQCHGYEGQGGSAGARLAPDPIPWQAIAAYIRKPGGQMPPYTSKLLSDSDVQDIYDYLKSRPGPTDIKNIPTFIK